MSCTWLFFWSLEVVKNSPKTMMNIRWTIRSEKRVNSMYLFISINQEVQWWWTSPPPESSPRRLFNHPSYHYYSFSEGRWPTGRILD
jgi:hypothetical protein